MMTAARRIAVRVARGGLLILAGAQLFGGAGAAASTSASFPLEAGGTAVIVPVRIGEHGPFDFILDTGASVTTIDLSLARELALPVTGTGKVKSPIGEGSTELPLVTLSGVAIEEMRLPDVEAGVLDLAAMLGGAEGARGVLSVRAFTEHLVTFDYPAGRLEIAPGKLSDPDGRTVWGYPAEARIPELPLVVAGQTTMVHLDTGSPGEITLPLEMAEGLPLQAEPVLVGQGMMVDRTFNIYAATLDGTATMGAIHIDRPRLDFIEGAPVGNVGLRFLQDRVLTLDPSRHRLRLVAGPSAEEGRPSPKPRAVASGERPKRYGVRFYQHDASPMPVAGVDEGSPAYVAGLREGDRIVELNGRPVGELGPADRADAFHASPLKLIVLRGEERLELTMRLE